MASVHGEWTERQGSNLGKPYLSRGLYRSSGRDQEAGPAPRRRAYRPGLRRSTERAVSTAVPAAAVAAQNGHGDRASPPEIVCSKAPAGDAPPSDASGVAVAPGVPGASPGAAPGAAPGAPGSPARGPDAPLPGPPPAPAEPPGPAAPELPEPDSPAEPPPLKLTGVKVSWLRSGTPCAAIVIT